MAIKLTAESFLNVVRQSSLVPQDQLKRLLGELRNAGTEMTSARAIADDLVERNVVTRWQAENLLKGKHRGYFLGKYRLLSLLGKGGMSSVYLAEHVLMRRRCAIKVLPAKRVNDTSYLGRFHREAQAVAALDHPNIVRAYDVDHEEDGGGAIHFLVMEYVEGRSLQEIVQQDGPLDFAEAAEMIRQSASGLAHAHSAGMVHRDIKPGNLLLDKGGTVKLLDLGLARFFGEGDEESLTVAHDEKVLGTADYLAPEQALDSHTVDRRADIYSLGCTFYFLLTGHPPFNEGTLAQRLMAHQTKTPPPVIDSRPDTPPELLAIVNKMMSKKPEDRYQTGEEVMNALGQWLTATGRATSALESGLETSGSVGTPQKPATAGSASDVPTAAPVPTPVVAPVVDPAANVHEPQAVDPRSDNDLSAFLAGLSANPIRPLTPAPGSGAIRPAASADPKSTPPKSTPPKSAPPKSTPPKSAQPKPGVGSPPTVQPAQSARPAQPARPAEPTPAASVRPPSAPTPPAVPTARPVAPTATPVARPVAPAAPVVAPQAQPARQSQPAAGVAPSFPGVAVAEAPGAAPNRPFALATDGGPRLASRRRRPSVGVDARALLKNKKLVAIAGGVLALLLVGAIFLFSKGGGDQTDPGEVPAGTNEPNSRSGVADGTKGGGEHGGDPRGLIGKPILVGGSKAHFQKLGEALEYVQHHYKTAPGRETQTIEIAGGRTLRERIVLRNTLSFAADHVSLSRGVRITSDPKDPAVLKPSGEQPVIELYGVADLVIENLRVEADGKPHAVHLAGTLYEVQLKNLKIAGYGEAGILCDGAKGGTKGNQQLVLTGLSLQGAGSSVGIMMQPAKVAEIAGTVSVMAVDVLRCRVLGPMTAGVVVGPDARSIRITENVFAGSGSGVGVRVESQDAIHQGVLIGNNTFHNLERGVVFTGLPKKDSGREAYGLRRNLFADIAGAPVALENGEAGSLMSQFFPANGIGLNYTTTANAGSQGVDVFSTDGGQTAVAVEFKATDPKDAGFLVPQPGSLPATGKAKPLSKVGSHAVKLQNWVGARQPK